jgi:hypothetical protein
VSSGRRKKRKIKRLPRSKNVNDVMGYQKICANSLAGRKQEKSDLKTHKHVD